MAKNRAAVEALEKLVSENYGDRTINISPGSIYPGAIGAALFAKRDVRGEALKIDITRLKKRDKSKKKPKSKSSWGVG